mmetsp:Transcript_76273/g.168437  ORF Transcript_76273/g.168437 Transcript_76273/m.168437 type:complete len:84 (-) Transcript_76273:681-932(-)
MQSPSPSIPSTLILSMGAARLEAMGTIQFRFRHPQGGAISKDLVMTRSAYGFRGALLQPFHTWLPLLSGKHFSTTCTGMQASS